MNTQKQLCYAPYLFNRVNTSVNSLRNISSILIKQFLRFLTLSYGAKYDKSHFKCQRRLMCFISSQKDYIHIYVWSVLSGKYRRDFITIFLGFFSFRVFDIILYGVYNLYIYHIYNGFLFLWKVFKSNAPVVNMKKNKLWIALYKKKYNYWQSYFGWAMITDSW